MKWNISHRIIGKIRKFNIGQRFVISYIVLCFFPMAAAGIFYYSQSSQEIRMKLGVYSAEIVSQIQRNVSDKFFKLHNDSIDLMLNEQLQEYMESFDRYTPSQLASKQTELLQMLMAKFSFSTDVEDILLISQQGDINYTYSNQKNKLYLRDSYIKTLTDKTDADGIAWSVLTWQNCFRKNNTYLKWDENVTNIDPNETSVLLCCTIKNLYSGKKYGYLVVNTKANVINEIFSDANIGADTFLFMLDERQIVAASNNRSLIRGLEYPLVPLKTALTKHKAAQPKSGIFDLKKGLSDDMVVYSRLNQPNWYIVCHISHHYLNTESLTIRVFILTLAVLSLTFALILSFAISSSIWHPLRRIICVIDAIKAGNLTAKIYDGGSDELTTVADSFDSMTDEINNLIAEIKQTEHKKRILELESLQSQINPHFIANTLNSVSWLAQIQKADNIVTIVNSLTHLLNESIRKDRETVSVRDEIRYIEKYITIQQYRYVSKINLEVQIPDRIMEQMIPKFVIEPLVENSVVHGLTPERKEIHIVIKSAELNGDITFSVIDDGAGMKSNPLEQPSPSPPGDRRGHGIGLRNVDSRLKLYYGEQYGVSIISIPNQFTIVDIRIATEQRKEEPL